MASTAPETNDRTTHLPCDCRSDGSGCDDDRSEVKDWLLGLSVSLLLLQCYDRATLSLIQPWQRPVIDAAADSHFNLNGQHAHLERVGGSHAVPLLNDIVSVAGDRTRSIGWRYILV